MEVQCQKLTGLVRGAAGQFDEVRRWAEHDGIVAPEHQSPSPGASFLQTMASIVKARTGSGTSEATDPDLTFAMREFLQIGQQVNGLRSGQFCARSRPLPEEDDDDDYDDDVVLPIAPAPGPVAAPAFKEDEGEEEDDDDTEVNGTALGELVDVEDGMQKKVTKFEGNVHPHGKKWWRYRYEYTLVESLVLAWTFIVIYLVMYLLHGVSFFGKFKFYNIGLTSRLYRYAWAYMVFHAAAVMILATVAYILYMPWGKDNIFDIGAKAFHKFVEGRANIPFLGYSWFIMAMDVLFQLFGTFAIYSLFLVFVVRNFQKALEDWKRLSNDVGMENCAAVNVSIYSNMLEILQRRVEASNSLQFLFTQAKLRISGLPGPELHDRDWHDFKLHLYLTDALGQALEYLVEVSLKSHIVLALSALLVALLAHIYHVAFMYFLPIFIVAGFLLFGVAFAIGFQLRRRASDHSHDQPLHFLTLHAYCRSIQIVLYCVFFSFARLLLSFDIFSDYPKVYLASAIGLLLTLLLCCWAAGEIMKETICAIVLPPQITEDRFKKNLAHVRYWYIMNNCHECGVRQFPERASLNQDWANQTGKTDDEALLSTDRYGSDRQWSFRQ
jgi:hypothetical protein